MSDSTPKPKKIIDVKFPNELDTGFGWDGSFTRKAWRKECLDNFLAGKEQFEAWQDSWNDKINKDLPEVSLAAVLTYYDNTTEEILNESYQAVTPATLDFVANIFVAYVDVSDFVFLEHADFNSATFTRNVDFCSVTFTGGADFSNAIFTGYADFSSSTFAVYAGFWGAAFLNEANFILARFNGYISFGSVKFAGAVDFSIATFASDAVFINATYALEADFSSAMFIEHAAFSNATFIGGCYFQGATFVQDADFFKAKFVNQCRFELTEKTDDLTLEWLRETWFMAEANFENAEFQNLGHFEGARFKTATPKFRGCKIGETRLEFDGDSYFPQGEQSTEAIKNISFLKRLADEHGQTDQALMFNAMELKAKRAQARSNTQHLSFKQKLLSSDFWFANATALYEKYSDYGRSFTKPLIGYLALMLITFSFALGHAMYLTERGCDGKEWWLFTNLWHEDIKCEIKSAKEGETPIRLTAWRASVEYTSYRASGILDFADSDKQTIAISNRLFNQPIEPPWMRTWGIFKGITSIALLFLAVLGLRNKYRIK
jgi:hypothetical protein